MGFHRLDAGAATVVFDVRDPAAARIAYLGPALAAGAPLSELALLWAEGARPSSPDRRQGVTLYPTAGEGFLGTPALALANGALLRLRLVTAGFAEASRFVLTWEEADLGLRLTQDWRPLGEGFCVSAALSNTGAHRVRISHFATLTLPLPSWAATRTTFAGRWAGEFQAQRAPLVAGVHETLSRGGRPGFENAGFLLLQGPGGDDDDGLALGVHLAWSGDSRSVVERLGFGEGQVQIAERLAPTEGELAPGGAHTTPEAHLVLSQTGEAGVRRAFHALAARLGAPLNGPRRVHFNSWEAVYFDLDLPRLQALAKAAAELGVERFVLDDGWFSGRRSDAAALGDWTPDPERFPHGLQPLIDHVAGLGMDFGLWVEPEMVSPNSALYRAHPDWALAPETGEAPMQRGQLVLDLTKPAVQAYLFEALDRLLAENAIAYLKWDHNRELFPSVTPRAQTLAFYQVLDALRAAHPNVEIEACASGGGRIDFEVMKRCARFWVSDNTDAGERLRIQTAASLFLPISRIGSHVGASPNPSTGRSLSMLFRARIAMFAHMGVEADPGKLTSDEAETLRGHIALYKGHRALIHGGDFLCYSGDDPAVTVWSCIAEDRSEALVLAARMTAAAGLVSPPVRMRGLADNRRYRMNLIRPWPEPARFFLGEAETWRKEPEVDGGLLQKAGMRLPLAHPETAWLIHLQAV